MVAGIQQQPHGQSLQQQQQPPLTTAEEEALKRNTDCVYFLASPLTCKKGSECEYRHSEYARVNPRDCWFWLNGNCLNPKCAFRHPPLDGLLGNQAATSAGSSVPASHTAPSPVTQVPYNPGKQPVPCIFFQKGYCLKGDKCAFLHGPNPASVKVSQAPVASHGSESLNFKAPGGLQKCPQEQRVPKTNIMNAVGFPPQASSAMRVEASLPKNGVSNKSNTPSIKAFDDEGLRYKAITTTASNGNPTSRSNRSHQVIVSDDQDFQNGKDNNDEYFRESSPGFDVLVDNELSDPDYFHSEDQFGKARGRDGRNLNSVDEYDMDSSMDYRSAADVDRKRYRDSTGYDSYDPVQGMSAWDQRGTSAERIGVGPAHLDRRGYRESGSPDQAYESDLRYRLSKQRRVGGLRSVVSNNHTMDNHGEERSNRGSSRRDSHQLPPNERSVSSRLRGRIKVPGESSSIDGGNIRPDREIDRGRNWGRLSPSRPQISSHQGRLRERIKGKVQEDYNKDGRNFLDMRIRREIMDERDTGFDGPKSLAQLKGGKNSVSKEQSHLGKRKNMRTMESQQSEGDASFDGPMPLSEILKRKRQAQAAGSGIAKSSSDKEDNNPTVKSVSGGGSRAYNAEMQPGLSATSKEHNDNDNLLSNKNDFKSVATDVAGAESEALGDIDAEDGVIYEETTGDQLLGAEDQRDGDYDYDQGDEGDYNYDGENVDPEEEYLEDEDGDDFAKKIGVLTS